MNSLKTQVSLRRHFSERRSRCREWSSSSCGSWSNLFHACKSTRNLVPKSHPGVVFSSINVNFSLSPQADQELCLRNIEFASQESPSCTCSQGGTLKAVIFLKGSVTLNQISRAGEEKGLIADYEHPCFQSPWEHLLHL